MSTVEAVGQRYHALVESVISGLVAADE